MHAPTLIVGLGGRGSEIVARVSEKIREDQKERINFVVFDTDVNELNQIKKNYPNVRYTVQTSTNMTVGDYLHFDEFTRTNSFPLNRNLYRKTLSEGAGQVRAISHLAFVTAMKRGNLAPLDEAIYDLYKMKIDDSSQALRVIIVSTLVGGTGSGLILPVSMYIRNFLKTRIQLPGSIVRGFFILPEIMFDVVRAEPMRYAFKANAYAVLREINAFILKADDNLHPRYKDKPSMKFPKIGTNDFEEYDVLPFDFCFMFDAQNIRGKKLNSTQQYLEHAAETIYAQSIGPMNTRSFSSEDNVIRTLVSGGSRNRYAGAGASELKYPSKHILQYIAKQWAVQTIAENWTIFDHDFRKRLEKNKQAALKGKRMPDLNRAEAYINAVDTKATTEKDPFSINVRETTKNFNKETQQVEDGGKWDKYIEKIEDLITREIDRGNEEIKSANKSAGSAISAARESDKENFSNDIGNAYKKLDAYKNCVERNVQTIGLNIANTLFDFDDVDDAWKNEAKMEYWLKTDTDETLHPNAIRYFLYQTLKTLEDKLQDVKKNVEKTEDNIKKFNEKYKSGGLTSAVEQMDAPTIDLTKKFDSQKSAFIEEFSDLQQKIASYSSNAPYVIVLKSAKDYVKQLCENFEKFYDSFDNSISDLKQQIMFSENQYGSDKGNTVRYVCSSKKCLEKIYESMQFTGAAMSIPSELCQLIYNQTKLYSSSDTKKVKNYFKDIFDKEIVNLFEKTIMEMYSSKIKMDVLTALEVEAEYEQSGMERPMDVEDYVKKVLTDTKKLSEPFINRPIGEEPVPIEACAYNKSLKMGTDDRKKLVLEELKSFGGVECDDEIMDNERVMFYQSIYGLFPEDLLKFAPVQESETTSPEAGEYYKAYFDMIGRIDPDPLKTKVITPHLDKRWHLISELPDLNDKLSEGQDKEIFKSLVLGLLYKRIKFEKFEASYRYTLFLNSSKKEIPLKPSNGTVCDTFYEIVDALTENPAIVKLILDDINEENEIAKKRNVIKFEDSTLYSGLKELTLPELSGDNRPMSIFGIAAAYKATTPPDDFVPDLGITLLETTLETIYEQMKLQCIPNELNNKYDSLIASQLETFTKNLNFYMEKHPAVLGDYLRSLLQVVISDLKEKGYTQAVQKAEEIRNRQFGNEVKETKKPLETESESTDKDTIESTQKVSNSKKK